MHSNNEKTSLAVFCPITSRVKGYPFEVALPAGGSIEGVILTDHVKNLDWKVRRARYIGTLPETELALVTARLKALLLPD